MCVPSKLKSYLHQINSKIDTNTIVSGIVTCCSCSEFDVLCYGNIKKSLLGHISLCDKTDGIVVRLRCKKCGEEIEVFNSFTDGYNRCIEEKVDCVNIQFQSFHCNAQEHSNFSVEVIFEYPPKQELIDDEITECDNAFSWIWISLKCNICNKYFKNFVDYETS
jgi:hypothetical protein